MRSRRGSAATAVPASQPVVDPRRHPAEAAAGRDGALRARAGPRDRASSSWCPREFLAAPRDALRVAVGAERRVLRQQPPRGRAAAHAHRCADRLPLDAELARARHSVRLVLGALDRNDRRAAGRRPPHRRRRQRRLSALPRRQARRSTTGGSSRTARGSPTSRGRRARRIAIRLEYFESTGNARLKLRLGRRRRRRQRARGSTKPSRSRAGATSRSSSPASKKVSSAIARCSACRAGRRS